MSYARRDYLHWYWVAIREAFVGVVLAIVGSAFEVEPLRWLGGGILLGAIVTALAAPAMARLSPLGGAWDANRALDAASALIAQALNRGHIAPLAV